MEGSKEIKLVKRNTCFLLIGLTTVFGISLLYNISNEKKTSTEYAKIEAISNFNNDLLYRRWASTHGGVYVPITDRTPPNPALKHIPERDIITDSGRKLTLLNPAYMTRQVYELEENQSGIKAHITSLKPIRPENKADEWETKALNEFENGQLEYYSIESINGAEYLRYMAALKTEEGCLKCHSVQGYKLGDIRGGISISVPMQKYYNAESEHLNKLILTHIAVFFVVVLLGFIGYRKFLASIYKGELARNEINISEAKLKLVTENISDVVWIMDSETNEFRYVSPSVRQLNGFTQEEVMSCGLIPLISPKSYESLSSKIPERLERFKQGVIEEWVDEVEQNHKDGSTFWTEVKARYINNTKTGRVEIVGVTHNISEQKKYQQELLKAKEKAEESDRLKSAFLANMSHEIRTPMNGIMGFADILDDPDTSQEQRGKYTSIIKSNGERLLYLMNNLIEYSKMEAGEIVISKTKADIPAIFERLDGIFQGEIAKKKIGLNFHIDSCPPNVFTDSNFLESVLINLIKNATKFTNKGSITVKCKKADGELIFCVQDTGIGVKQENINSIFERFNQEDISLNKKFDGAGLGLAISKSYIELLGGRIWAESEVGKGSSFYFTIPLDGDK